MSPGVSGVHSIFGVSGVTPSSSICLSLTPFLTLASTSPSSGLDSPQGWEARLHPTGLWINTRDSGLWLAFQRQLQHYVTAVNRGLPVPPWNPNP